jgi:predicted RNA-binding protein with PIN domain
MGGIQSDLEQGEATAVIRGRVPSAKIEPYRQVLTGYTSGEGKLHVTQCGYDAACDADTVIEETGYDAEHDTANPADSVFVSHTGSDIVKWDEVFEHMHLTGVLKSGTRVENRYIADPREAARRRMAAEKDLQRIFEMTYGQAKPKRYIESKTVTAGEDDLSEEEAADRAARNEEIRAKHEKKSAPGDERPPLLLIDGYNLIFADEELKELSTIDAGSARDSLIERLVNYAGYTGMEVKLVFDAYKVAPGDGSTEKYSGVEVIFTAADELADVRIGRMADAAGTRRVYVVSSDRLVQQDVWTKGAMRISSREFLENLSRTEDEIRARLKM